MPEQVLVEGPDGRRRCWWCEPHDDYRAYHDREWGRPMRDDRALFEKLCLEGFQAGLSWLTILRKREHFRRAFRDFEIRRVARFDRRSVARLMRDAGIVRNRLKIEAAIHNARRALELQDECGSLAEFFWRWRADEPSGGMPDTTPGSHDLSRALKRRGWRFVGPTTIYAYMQSIGLVNDHLPGCALRGEVERARQGKKEG